MSGWPSLAWRTAREHERVGRASVGARRRIWRWEELRAGLAGVERASRPALGAAERAHLWLQQHDGEGHERGHRSWRSTRLQYGVLRQYSVLPVRLASPPFFSRFVG